VALGDWRRYLAPAAFLLAATIAVVLIRAGIESGGGSSSATRARAPVSQQVTTTAATTTAVRRHKRTAAAKRFWTVQAGDTFAVVASKTGVPVATIERLNPTVRSTSLFIGEKLRIR
jgi:LysM repeat protein